MYYQPVYSCKLCGNKHIVDAVMYHGVCHEDLYNFYDFEENRLLHNQVDKLGCFGLLEFIGFVQREGDDEK